ncbi:MAG: PEP-CTERM sorting domain-containing protein [Sedimentisphaerales bacterium]|nr:PEP-CTERM sorting domain-containing protein [Sedimentisphaerales bacterium]
MERSKIKAGVIVAMLGLSSAFASAAVSSWDGVDASLDSFVNLEPDKAYKTLIKQGRKVLASDVVYDELFNYYGNVAPVVQERDLFSGGISDDSNGNLIYQRVSASTDYSNKSKDRKNPIYTYTLSNTAAARAVYDIDRDSLKSLFPGVNTNTRYSKALVTASTMTTEDNGESVSVLNPVYLRVDKSGVNQKGLLAKYVVNLNRVIERVITKGDEEVTKEYVKRLAKGVVSVYSDSNGALTVKVSGGINKDDIKVSLFDNATGTESDIETEVFTGLNNANNKKLKDATLALDDFYIKIEGVAMSKDFWYSPKSSDKFVDTLYVDVVAESTVYAKQLDELVLANDVQAVRVPEPATLGLLAIGGLLMGKRFKK